MTIKLICPHCQQHIEAPSEAIGTKLTCPTCKNELPLGQKSAQPQSDDLRKEPTPPLQIHISKNGMTDGPYSVQQLREKAASGTLTSKDFAWYEGCSDWIAVTQIKGVFTGPPPAKRVVPQWPKIALAVAGFFFLVSLVGMIINRSGGSSAGVVVVGDDGAVGAAREVRGGSSDAEDILIICASCSFILMAVFFSVWMLHHSRFSKHAKRFAVLTILPFVMLNIYYFESLKVENGKTTYYYEPFIYLSGYQENPITIFCIGTALSMLMTLAILCRNEARVSGPKFFQLITQILQRIAVWPRSFDYPLLLISGCILPVLSRVLRSEYWGAAEVPIFLRVCAEPVIVFTFAYLLIGKIFKANASVDAYKRAALASLCGYITVASITLGKGAHNSFFDVVVIWHSSFFNGVIVLAGCYAVYSSALPAYRLLLSCIFIVMLSCLFLAVDKMPVAYWILILAICVASGRWTLKSFMLQYRNEDEHVSGKVSYFETLEYLAGIGHRPAFIRPQQPDAKESL